MHCPALPQPGRIRACTGPGGVSPLPRLEPETILINAHQMVTLRGPNRPRVGADATHLGTVPKGAIAIKDGRILHVGSTEEMLRRCAGSDPAIIDCTGRLVLPGFVDPHTHVAFAGSREDELQRKLEGASYLQILKEGGGILRTTRATRNSTAEAIAAQTRRRLDAMLATGTTTVEVKSGYGLTTRDEIKSLEVIAQLQKEHPLRLVPTFLGAHAVPQEYTDRPDDYVTLVVDEMIPQVAAARLATHCDVFCEEGVFSVAQSERVLQAGKDAGLRPRAHIDELVNLGGAEMAARLGAVTVEHLVCTTDSQVELLARAGTIGCLLPGTPYMLMDGRYPQARRMVQRNLPLAIATDCNPNCWIESMQFIIGLSCMMLRLTPEEAITAATINGAYAVGLGEEVGSLDVGKRADILLLDVPTYQHLPYHQGSNAAVLVLKDGKVVVDRRDELHESGAEP